MINETELIIEENGTKPEVIDPLAQARELIAKELQGRANETWNQIQELLTAKNCELRPVIQVGEAMLLIPNVAGLPVIVQLIAK